jgi:hypothetical protein
VNAPKLIFQWVSSGTSYRVVAAAYTPNSTRDVLYVEQLDMDRLGGERWIEIASGVGRGDDKSKLLAVLVDGIQHALSQRDAASEVLKNLYSSTNT